MLLAGSALALTIQPASALNVRDTINKSREGDKPHMYTISITNADEAQAEKFINDLAQNGINFLENESQTKEEKAEAFRNLLRKNFDMKTIGRFSLGKYWRDASNEQQEEYLKLFEKMIIDVYSRRFSEYNGQELKIIGTESVGRRDILVKSKIIQTHGGPDVSVAWRVRQGKTGTMKIIDISVEGVSMSLTQRADFSSVIQRGGGNVEALLEHLR